MSTFSERLIEVRKDRKMTQEGFAELGGVKKRSQINYEKGDRQPDSAYLEALSAAGIDVNYLITGEDSLPPSLAADEQMLVDAYRSLPMKQQKALLASLLMGNTPAEQSKPDPKPTIKPKAKPKNPTGGVVVSGDGNMVAGENNSVRIVGGDYTEN